MAPTLGLSSPTKRRWLQRVSICRFQVYGCRVSQFAVFRFISCDFILGLWSQKVGFLIWCGLLCFGDRGGLYVPIMLQGWQLIEGKALVVVWGILEWKVGCGVEMAGTGFVLVMLRPMLMMLVALLGQMVRWCWVEGGIGS